jgi:hypothetical protein
MRGLDKKTASVPFFYLVVFASQKLQLKHGGTAILGGGEYG